MRPLDREDRRFLIDLMHRHTGVALTAGQEHLIDNRLQIVANRHGLGGVQPLISILRLGTSTPLLAETIDALCTHETSFFRDGHPWDALATQVLPALAARRRKRRILDLWCAACSSGQEVWSLAMTIRERVDDLQGWTIRIVATDVSQPMVDRTRAATYSTAELARGVPERLRGRYFVRQGDQWQVRADLRAMVEPMRDSLTAPGSSRSFDLILVRNVLIYFDDASRRRAVDRLHHSLAPDGALLLGTGENLTDPRYAPTAFGRTVVYSPRGSAPPSLRAQESP